METSKIIGEEALRPEEDSSLMALCSTAFWPIVNKLKCIKLYCDLIKLHICFVRNSADTLHTSKITVRQFKLCCG